MTTPFRLHAALPFLVATTGIITGGCLANAATFDKEQEVKTILERMSSDVLAFRDEIEAAYSQRCSADTLSRCSRGNYNDCSSTFPNQMCMDPSELVMQQCGNGQSCNALWDKTISTVAFPAALATGEGGNPTDHEIIETACYTLQAEEYMVEKYQDDTAFWTQWDASPSWSYFGAHNGMFRHRSLPHRHSSVADTTPADDPGTSRHRADRRMCYW